MMYGIGALVLMILCLAIAAYLLVVGVVEVFCRKYTKLTTLAALILAVQLPRMIYKTRLHVLDIALEFAIKDKKVRAVNTEPLELSWRWKGNPYGPGRPFFRTTVAGPSGPTATGFYLDQRPKMSRNPIAQTREMKAGPYDPQRGVPEVESTSYYCRPERTIERSIYHWHQPDDPDALIRCYDMEGQGFCNMQFSQGLIRLRAAIGKLPLSGWRAAVDPIPAVLKQSSVVVA